MRGLPGYLSFDERTARSARRRWLPEGRRGPMPWIIAIMMFLTLLAGGGGLALAHSLIQMRGELAGGYTIQIVEADNRERAAQTTRLSEFLRRATIVEAVIVVPQNDLEEQLAPWIGSELARDELPLPALIDIKLKPGISNADIENLALQVRHIAPAAQMDAHSRYLAPVEKTMQAMIGLAVGLVLMMILVTGAVVTLVTRSAHDTHRSTIDIMHHLGATDMQIARLFQTRMALDAIFGACVGIAAAAIVIGLLRRSIISMQSEFMAMMAMPVQWWGVLIVLPLAGIALSVFIARLTVRRELERRL